MRFQNLSFVEMHESSKNITCCQSSLLWRHGNPLKYYTSPVIAFVRLKVFSSAFTILSIVLLASHFYKSTFKWLALLYTIVLIHMQHMSIQVQFSFLYLTSDFSYDQFFSHHIYTLLSQSISLQVIFCQDILMAFYIRKLQLLNWRKDKR